MRFYKTLVLSLVVGSCMSQLEHKKSRAQDSQYSDAEKAIVKMTNDFRSSSGFKQLTTSKPLHTAATKFARFMLAEEKYGHQADGRRPAQRAEDAGYDYCVIRENIAYIVDPKHPDSSTIASDFFNGWKTSEGHRENMLGEHLEETAVAVASDNGKTFYAVQLFGRPASAKFKVDIENRTDASQVLLFRTEDSRDEITIPPRTVLTLSRCIPTTISLESGNDRMTVTDSGKLTIAVSTDDKVRLAKQNKAYLKREPRLKLP